MTLTQRLARATLALAIAGFCASSPAVAQDWKAVWQKTVDAANAEGTLLFYSQPNQAARDFILREAAVKLVGSLIRGEDISGNDNGKIGGADASAEAPDEVVPF